MVFPFTEDGARMFLLVMSPSASPVETVAFGTFHSISSKVTGYSSVVEFFLSIFKALGFTPSLAKKYIIRICVWCIYLYIRLCLYVPCMSVAYVRCVHICAVVHEHTEARGGCLVFLQQPCLAFYMDLNLGLHACL